MRNIDEPVQIWNFLIHELEIEARIFKFFRPKMPNKTVETSTASVSMYISTLEASDNELIKNCIKDAFTSSFPEWKSNQYYEESPGFCYTLKEGDTAQVLYLSFENIQGTTKYIHSKIRALMDSNNEYSNLL